MILSVFKKKEETDADAEGNTRHIANTIPKIPTILCIPVFFAVFIKHIHKIHKHIHTTDDGAGARKWEIYCKYMYVERAYRVARLSILEELKEYNFILLLFYQRYFTNACNL